VRLSLFFHSLGLGEDSRVLVGVEVADRFGATSFANTTVIVQAARDVEEVLRATSNYWNAINSSNSTTDDIYRALGAASSSLEQGLSQNVSDSQRLQIQSNQRVCTKL